jgi:two-component system, NarL family, sensor histidine kinase DevS
MQVVVDDDLRIEVIDDGCGVPDDITDSGLTNLRRRAEQVGGSFAVESPPGGGTLLRWSAPLRSQ